MKEGVIQDKLIYKGQLKGRHAHYIYPKVTIFQRLKDENSNEPWLPYCSLCGGWTFENPVPKECEYCGATMDEEVRQ